MMMKRFIQILAGLAVAGALGGWAGSSWLDARRLDAERAAQSAANRAWPAASDAARRLELAGAAMLDDLASGASFDVAAERLTSANADAPALSLTVRGVVELGVAGADGLPAASRSLPTIPNDDPTAAAEDDATLRRGAEAAFRAAAAWAGAPRATLAPATRGFWALWGDADHGRVLAALVTAASGGVEVTAVDPATSTAPIVARFGGGALALSADLPFTPTSAQRAVLSSTTLVTMLVLGVMLLLVFARRRVSGEAAARAAEQAEADRRVAELEKKLKHLAESANVIPWTANLDQNRFTYIGSRIETLSGYSAATWKASGFWFQHIHQDDRQKVMAATSRRYEEGEYQTVAYRIRASDRGTLYIRNIISITERREGGPHGKVVREAHGFLLDETESYLKEEQLRQARSEAEDANRVKSEFLANMSHELRTPLNVVIGFSEIMKDQVFGPVAEGYREYATYIHSAGTHLLALINDVLDLSKIEAGRVELIQEPTNLGALLEECRELMEDRMRAAGLRCRMEIDPAPSVMVDERRIKQVILNLVSNAIKFTNAGGEITLSLRREPGRRVTVAVGDTGIGIAKKDIPKALSKFSQIDSDLARKHDGTGLGLPIAKSLIELHGGVFELASEEGVGTTASFHLPEQAVAVAA